MGFTKNEAETKVGKRVGVCDDSLANDEIARGTTGKIVEAYLPPGMSESGVGRIGTTGGRKREGHGKRTSTPV
jgi:hypothetical protein